MTSPETFLDISINGQQLKLFCNGELICSYPVSTAKNGPGALRGSECTPCGWHRVRAKIGEGLPLHSVLVGRRPTGEIYDDNLAQRYPNRDWILTRILWLGGLEPGVNRYGMVDTTWRYIYIHGSPDGLINGQPGSHGCIRMKNADMLDLFNRVSVGIKVFIHS